ncbi:MAG: Maf family protein [bacterium]
MAPPLVLASASPRRAELLRGLGVRFEQVLSGVPEDHALPEPEDAAVDVALRKAAAVSVGRPDALVLGADTVVVTPEGDILDKPADRGEAAGHLMRLSGRTHRVITGLALVHPARPGPLTCAESTRVTMRPYTRDEAVRYAASGESLDKAGAYGIQGRGGLLVERVEGCYFNVVGLPLVRLARMLSDLGWDPVREWLGPEDERGTESG